MAGKTHRGTWKAFERAVAKTDFDTRRMPLSGANSGHGGGDVLLPDGADFLVECKYRAGFLHHSLFEAAEADAKKHGRDYAILYTKVKGQHGWLVTVDKDTFSRLIRAAAKGEECGES